MHKSSKMFTRALRRNGFTILTWTEENVRKVTTDTTGKLVLLLPGNKYLNCHDIQPWVYVIVNRASMDACPCVREAAKLIQLHLPDILADAAEQAQRHATMMLDSLHRTLASPEFQNISEHLQKMSEILRDIQMNHEEDENGNIKVDERWEELHKQCMFTKEAFDPIAEVQEIVEQERPK